jgi:DNA-binding transcriptional regulator GbsR (MarR family)
MNSNTNNGNLRHESLLGYAEEWGLLFERWGLPRTAGRIWGWLHVCEPPLQTAGQLVDALGVSKVSQARALADRGLGVLESASPERKQRLTAKRDFYAFLEREMEELLRHWQGRREEGTLVD